MYRYLIIVILTGIIGGIIARKKGYNQILWFILCAIIPLLIFVILVLPTQPSKGLTKKCPFCSEIIKDDAIVCRYCGNNVIIR